MSECVCVWGAGWMGGYVRGREREGEKVSEVQRGKQKRGRFFSIRDLTLTG